MLLSNIQQVITTNPPRKYSEYSIKLGLTFSTIKTVCHCDDPNFKLFREIQLDSHPIVLKKNDQLVFFITHDLQICRFQ